MLHLLCPFIHRRKNRVWWSMSWMWRGRSLHYADCGSFGFWRILLSLKKEKVWAHLPVWACAEARVSHGVSSHTICLRRDLSQNMRLNFVSIKLETCSCLCLSHMLEVQILTWTLGSKLCFSGLYNKHCSAIFPSPFKKLNKLKLVDITTHKIGESRT